MRPWVRMIRKLNSTCLQHQIATIEGDGNKYCFLFPLLQRVVGMVKGEIIGQPEEATTLQRNSLFLQNRLHDPGLPRHDSFLYAQITTQISNIITAALERWNFFHSNSDSYTTNKIDTEGVRLTSASHQWQCLLFGQN
uniref:Putative ovule protein n=1 Tax=Solanum chacoense TaxID=4108 RepID=A0A0V0HH74_SOLCH